MTSQTSTIPAPLKSAAPALQAMFDCLSSGNPVYLPSRFWEVINDRNLKELTEDGIENIKQTVARSYFTWVVDYKSDQFRFLCRQMRFNDWTKILGGIFTLERNPYVGRRRWIEMRLFTRMLWRFVQRSDPEELLQKLEEPPVGNPFPIYLGKRLISQDIANSVMEYYSVREHFQTPPNEPVTICELGAGYGRNAYVFLKALPRSRYIIVDIPPALYISQQYLSAVFPEKRLFAFRCFDRYSDVADELEAADIVFLLPHQAEMLPRKSVDLFVNISSLHEMTLEQIHAYFQLIDRLTRGYFYSKQWYTSQNLHDKLQIKHTDYPIPADWNQLYLRTAGVQVAFFEAMYAIHADKGA